MFCLYLLRWKNNLYYTEKKMEQGICLLIFFSLNSTTAFIIIIIGINCITVVQLSLFDERSCQICHIFLFYIFLELFQLV